MAATFVLLWVSADPEDPAAPDESEAAVDMTAEPEPNAVAAPVADPFSPYRGVNTVAEGLVDTDTEGADDGSDDRSEPSDGEQEDPMAFSAAMATAQEVAVAFGTWSYADTPGEYVAAVPHLSEQMQVELTASAEDRWPAIQDAQVSATARLVGTAPQVVYQHEESETVQASVTVQQSIDTRDGSEGRARSYVVTLQSTTTDAGVEWVATRVTL